MTSFPFKQLGKTAEVFFETSAEQSPRPEDPRKPATWAKQVLKSLLHAALAASLTGWYLRGYVDQINARLDRESDRRESIEHRLEGIQHQLERAEDRVDAAAKLSKP